MAVIFNNYKRSSYLCNITYGWKSFNYVLITSERHLTLSVLSSFVTVLLHLGDHPSPKQ